MKEDKTQRICRTRNELKEATLRAVSELSKEKGLSRITMVDIGEKAGIRVDVLKRNYTSVEKILQNNNLNLQTGKTSQIKERTL